MRTFPNSIRIENIIGLLRVAESLQDPIRERLRQMYETHYLAFESTLAFLNSLQGVSIFDDKIIIQNESLKIKKYSPRQSRLLTSAWINSSLLQKRSPYVREIRNFIAQFNFTDGGLSAKTNSLDTRKSGAIRDLFMDTELLVRDNLLTLVVPDMVEAVITFMEESAPGRNIKRRLLAQEELGRMAEVIVLDFERERLKEFPNLVKKIKHVSKESPGAGYDIRSFDTTGSTRFVEVKAVRLIDFRFFWFRNEIKVASRYRDSYYLYLLPFASSVPIVADLNMIQNPFHSIMKSGEPWIKEIEAYECKLDLTNKLH